MTERWLVCVLFVQATVLMASAFKGSSLCRRPAAEGDGGKAPSLTCHNFRELQFPEALGLIRPNLTHLWAPLLKAVANSSPLSPVQCAAKWHSGNSTDCRSVHRRLSLALGRLIPSVTVHIPLPQEDYCLVVEMRFHWGSKTTNGSEHTLNKRRFPMEIGDTENLPFKVISDTISSLSYLGDSPPALIDLMPADILKFYQYSGGQTTPPYLMTVSWVVLEKPMFISKNQYLPFATSLYSDKRDSKKKLLVENYCPIQSNFMRQQSNSLRFS